MSVVSMRSKKRMLEIFLSGFICASSFLMQMLVLNNFSIHGSICNLPLTLCIVWGLVFGSRLSPLTALELRKKSMGEVFSRQLASGSHSGFLIGWLLSLIYFMTSVPVYPVAYPIIGWAAGYFCLRSLSQGNLLSIPLTFILTIVAEGLMSWELFALGRGSVFDHLSTFILPEALLNSIIAPFIYFPMRRWYDLMEGQQAPFPHD